MSRLIVIVMVLALVSVGNAANLLSNSSFETYADDGYGRMMPGAPYGLYLSNNDWGDIPSTQVITTSAHTGAASFQLMGTATGTDVLTAGVGNLPGAGESYVLSAWVNTTAGVNGTFGASMFAPNYGGWWWGGSNAIPNTNGEWQQITFGITVGAPSAWNLEVTAFSGSSPILIDDVSFVPEPATMALLGLGGLVLRRRRK